MITTEERLMRLASSSYWQGIYHASKECYGIKLFENETNFSSFQSEFLFWLRVYTLLSEELNSKEYPFLDDRLLKDPVRVKAFLYYRKKRLDKQMEDSKRNERKTGVDLNKKHYKVYKGPRPDSKKVGDT